MGYSAHAFLKRADGRACWKSYFCVCVCVCAAYSCECCSYLFVKRRRNYERGHRAVTTRLYALFFDSLKVLFGWLIVPRSSLCEWMWKQANIIHWRRVPVCRIILTSSLWLNVGKYACLPCPREVGSPNVIISPDCWERKSLRAAGSGDIKDELLVRKKTWSHLTDNRDTNDLRKNKIGTFILLSMSSSLRKKLGAASRGSAAHGGANFSALWEIWGLTLVKSGHRLHWIQPTFFRSDMKGNETAITLWTLVLSKTNHIPLNLCTSADPPHKANAALNESGLLNCAI